MSPLETAIARARTLPCWDTPPELEPLEGGITNLNLLATTAAGKYVVRFGLDIPEHGVMRFNELAISRAAAEAGISPGVHHSEPGILVLDFVQARALTPQDMQNPIRLQATTALIRRAHTLVTPLARGPVLSFWVFHVLRDYAAFLRTQNSGHVPVLDQLMSEAQALETAVGRVQIVLGHNDLLPANVLQSDDRLWLIDWEYGGYNSPLFDLGGLATNCDLPPEAEALMLQTYFATPPDDGLWRSYGAMKCASLLRETMWSMVSEITSEIAFDYAAYTRDNLARYQQALSDYTSQRGST